jgi:hypothetical protein
MVLDLSSFYCLPPKTHWKLEVQEVLYKGPFDLNWSLFIVLAHNATCGGVSIGLI